MKLKNKFRTILPICAAFLLMVFSGSTKLSAQNCITGCNSNTYTNSADPNTIEYDNLISAFHASLAKEKDGAYKIWGQTSGSNGADLYTPTIVAPGSGNGNFNYTGTALKVAAGSNSTTHQFAVLTTDGLYVWGTNNILISSAIRNVNTFGKITVNGKTDGLPAGVSPTDVKMMFGSYRTLTIVTCTGDAWVLSAHGSKNGDGTAQDATNNAIWHRVKTNADGNPNLTGVVALRGTPNALFALTSTGDLYTWGTGTYINSGTASARIYATPVSKPSGTTPKMIGMTQGGANASMPTSQTYYLLATDGKLYAMGNNSNRQLGDGTTNESLAWKEVTATSGTNTLGGNIVWISPNEHSNYENSAAINVLTTDNRQWGWGSNSGNMLGQNGGTYFNPIYMPGNSTNANGLNLTDEVIAVETGGHTTVNVKKCSQFFGYVGHKTNGSMGDGSTANTNPYLFSYSTSVLIVCGTDLGPKVKEMKICEGTTANLNNANLEEDPNLVEWHATNDATSPILTDITAVGPGTYYAFFSAASGKCRLVGSVVVVSYAQPGDSEYTNSCVCYNPAVKPGTGPDTKVGITLLQRAGSDDADQWPMVRKSGHIALESNTQGFVVSRIAKANLGNITNPQEGMMVYDTTDKCLKIYSDGAWRCFVNPGCP